MHLFQPTCEGDAIARDLVLVLTFEQAVAADSVTVTLEVAG
jgi:hypothetical protein